MKPRIFIGSSSENLNVAYAIQENLDYEANTTVWNQGVFKLSQNTIDSLFSALENSDFAIFVFQPDDISIIRQQKVHTVRDNLVFELGLFFGRLGKERVFFLQPRNTEALHLPSDLLGITPGIYDAEREDGNIKAAVGSFCNQVRIVIKEFVLDNFSELTDESHEARKIVFDKSPGWEYKLTTQLLTDRLPKTLQMYTELMQGLIPQRVKKLSGKEFFDWYVISFSDFLKLSKVLTKSMEELNVAYGPIGQHGNALDIKIAIDRIFKVAKEAILWEYELYSLEPPEELKNAKGMIQGGSRIILDKLEEMLLKTNLLLKKLEQPLNGHEEIEIVLKLEVPDEFQKAMEIFQDYDFENDL